MLDVVEVSGSHPGIFVFGFAGFACQMLWPLFTRRRTMLGVQMGIGAGYGAQYALLDAWSAAGIAFLGATQTAIALVVGEHAWLRYLGVVFLPLAAALCYFSWDGMESLFALIACSLVMLGRLQSDTLHMRALMLAASPFGIGHDIAAGAIPALCGAVASGVLMASALFCEWRQRQQSEAFA